jgi:hypothetical protein
MFERARLIGSREPTIKVQTRLGTDIQNAQAPPPNEMCIGRFDSLLKKRALWVLRKRPCGLYNCFGLIWASRRTSIYEQDQIEIILRDDGYRPLGDAESLHCGDLVIYYGRGGSDIWHVGKVMELRNLVVSGQDVEAEPSRIPWVLSKWNDSAGEVLHHYTDVPWPEDEFEFRFWTDREGVR